MPPGISKARRWARRTFDSWRFDRAMRRFVDDPVGAIRLGSPVLPNLIDAWGNSGWSAKDEYLRIGIEHAMHTKGPILECGTGLSTLLLGVVAQQRGLEYWALEHLPVWSEKIAYYLSRRSLTGVQVSTRPLRRYEGFDWYDPPLHEMPLQFSLVICDGPPSQTRGSRYGLVPVMRTHLKPGCTILLDDAEREAERLIAGRWAVEMGSEAEYLDGKKPLIRLVVSGDAHGM